MRWWRIDRIFLFLIWVLNYLFVYVNCRYSPSRQRYSPIKLIDPGVLIWASAVIMISVDSIGVVGLSYSLIIFY